MGTIRIVARNLSTRLYTECSSNLTSSCNACAKELIGSRDNYTDISDYTNISVRSRGSVNHIPTLHDVRYAVRIVEGNEFSTSHLFIVAQ